MCCVAVAYILVTLQIPKHLCSQQQITGPSSETASCIPRLYILFMLRIFHIIFPETPMYQTTPQRRRPVAGLQQQQTGSVLGDLMYGGRI
jgi:hypothetical protein